mmetsp:Transcript_18917/g.44002  ORF Transcript_18917/g.44002 Transcript_18917/m.44002 type:complete len:234 (-) Transcript_18917:279-980(-)
MCHASTSGSRRQRARWRGAITWHAVQLFAPDKAHRRAILRHLGVKDWSTHTQVALLRVKEHIEWCIRLRSITSVEHTSHRNEDFSAGAIFSSNLERCHAGRHNPGPLAPQLLFQRKVLLITGSGGRARQLLCAASTGVCGVELAFQAVILPLEIQQLLVIRCEGDAPDCLRTRPWQLCHLGKVNHACGICCGCLAGTAVAADRSRCSPTLAVRGPRAACQPDSQCASYEGCWR